MMFGRETVIALSVGTLATVLVGCLPMNRHLYRDQLVNVSEQSTVNFLNVHASADRLDLEIFGKKFQDVRGTPPYYLTLPNTNLILFVTGKPFSGQAMVRIANTNTHVIQSFPAYDSRIGEDINGLKKRWNVSEGVEYLNGANLVIKGSHFNQDRRCYIDLNSPAFIKEEFETVRPDNQRVRITLPQGKRSLQKVQVLDTP